MCYTLLPFYPPFFLYFLSNATVAPLSTASDHKSLVSIFLSFTNTIISLLIKINSNLIKTRSRLTMFARRSDTDP